MAQDPIRVDITSQDGYSITFNRNQDPNALGIEFWVNKIDGWDSPNMRQNLLARYGTEGGVVAESFNDHRVLVVNGYCWARNPDDLWVARQSISRVSQASYSDGTLTVYEPSQAGGTKTLAFRRFDKINMAENDGTDGFAFGLNFVGPDPRKYQFGTPNQANVAVGSTTVANAGDMGTWPKFVWAGGATAGNPIQLTRSVDGARVQINTSLTSSDTLVVDFGSRTVVKNGALRYDLVDGTTIWWQLLPGNNTFTSTGTCVVQWLNAWG